VDIYQRYLTKHSKTEDARLTILDFLKWDEPDEDMFGREVKILLPAANFSKELTTAVMWLNKHEVDIRCVRVIPYQNNGRVLIDVQQIIPLPEASDYQIQIREKEHKGRQERGELHIRRERFWQVLPGSGSKCSQAACQHFTNGVPLDRSRAWFEQPKLQLLDPSARGLRRTLHRAQRLQR